ncbi:MAG: type VI secretion system-associated FHA domain protein TagH [Pseudomonadota bacterium]
MEMRLILEHAPTSQAVTEMAFQGGQMTVGRGQDADWRIHDPDNFISRKHFVVSSEGDHVVITDASSGGLFVDGATEALGPGNSVRVEDGMRLRFGDFVARIETGAARADTPRPDNAKAASPFDFAFEAPEETAGPTERPDTLPEPFGRVSSPFFRDEPDAATPPPQPIDRDNPFALGLKPQAPEPEDGPAAFGGGSKFFPQAGERQEPVEPPDVPIASVAPEPTPPPAAPQAVTDDAALRAAFFKGLGIDASDIATDDPEAEMEALGRRFRALADGVTHLLRTRAAEKQKVRVAQTIIGSSNVNPLKFAVSAEEAVSALIAARGPGYLDPDASIDEAFRDLIDHQMRTWAALQAALRRMIHKFDPEAIERELEDTGLLEKLIAGGESAKLWQLYQERYAEIARAAEERFLGEIGADFRDEYER